MNAILRIADSTHLHSHCGAEPVECEHDGAGQRFWECCDCGLMRFVNVNGGKREEQAWEAGYEALAADYLAHYGLLDGSVATNVYIEHT